MDLSQPNERGNTMKYEMQAEGINGYDRHETNCPVNAIEWIQDSRLWATLVTYTGNPFADFTALLEE